MNLALAGELAPLGLGEAGLFALGGDLTDNGTVDRGMGRLAAGRLPVALGLGRLDHFLGRHRLARLFEHLGRGVQAAGAFGFVGLGLLGSGLLGLGVFPGNMGLVALGTIAVLVDLGRAAVNRTF